MPEGSAWQTKRNESLDGTTEQGMRPQFWGCPEIEAWSRVAVYESPIDAHSIVRAGGGNEGARARAARDVREHRRGTRVLGTAEADDEPCGIGGRDARALRGQERGAAEGRMAGGS